jgi:hypothetical protein
MSVAVGVIPILLVFPEAVRATGLAITYSLGVAISGGTATYIVAWLVGVTRLNLLCDDECRRAAGGPCGQADRLRAEEMAAASGPERLTRSLPAFATSLQWVRSAKFCLSQPI